MNKTTGILVLVLVCLLIPACEKVAEEDLMTFEKEMELLDEFLVGNNITAAPTASGLYFILLEDGAGPLAKTGNAVTVYYTGRLINGVIFDQTDTSNPFTFQLGVDPVIQGWSEGISMMKAGDIARLIIPSTLGYGAFGSAGTIPPFSTLIFEVQLLSIGN